ncbi:MAG TPA: type II CAAX endopeptidase family protein [Verrucomicrobiae bacterium]|nr:type II CAAX endopeptidase family protein [Verrucomicrobiae bacterium]
MTTVPKNWRAGKAWICFASLIAMQVVLAIIVVIFCRLIINRPSTDQPITSVVLNATGGLLAVIITLLFARPGTVEQVKSFFALERPKLETALALTAAGAGLAAVIVLLIKHGFTPPRNPLVKDLSASGPSGMIWLRFLLLAAPFVEEFVMRGFLYPAFRQSYSITFSVVSILVIAVFEHLPMTTSIIGPAAVISLNVLLCLVRERTGNLWNCILCHLAYNIVCTLT